MAPTGATILEVRDLTKSFYGVAANNRVSFDLRAGEVHGLLGENGAGKSTLCSVMAGLYRPDHGEVRIDGRPVNLRSPHEAAALGVGMVYQHFRLVPNLTVTENLVLGLPDQPMRLSLRAAQAKVAALAEEYGLRVDPGSQVWQLSVGEQQRVEILKQLFRGARILILDEPTAVLAPQECDRLFEVVAKLASEGHAVVLVSHKMEEILGHTHRVTVLAHGVNAGTVRTADTTAAALATMMIGAHDFGRITAGHTRPDGEAETLLHITDLHVIGDHGTPTVRGANLVVGAGEIVGVAGVAGNGQRELQEAIAGLRPTKSGTVLLSGADITRASPRQRSEAGLSYIPEDRLGTGLARGLTLEENLALRSYRKRPHSRMGVLSHKAIGATARSLVDRFDVRGARGGMPVSLMSGGNLQRAILARELTRPHQVLLAASPTRGLDLAATAAVRSHILDEAESGRAVLLFSEDLAEITELSHRIVVMSQGRIVGNYTPETLDVAELGLLMTGAAGDAS